MTYYVYVILYYILAYIQHNGDVSLENYSSVTILWLSRICCFTSALVTVT